MVPGKLVPVNRVIALFMENGFTKVYALKGGWLNWVKAGYPTESK
jgi:rhodanese-related sulfurtransferase